jgi:hypothetical protein
VSAFFTRVTLAMLTMLIVYFISFLPFVVLVSSEVFMTHWQKTLAVSRAFKRSYIVALVSVIFIICVIN